MKKYKIIAILVGFLLIFGSVFSYDLTNDEKIKLDLNFEKIIKEIESKGTKSKAFQDKYMKSLIAKKNISNNEKEKANIVYLIGALINYNYKKTINNNQNNTQTIRSTGSLINTGNLLVNSINNTSIGLCGSAYFKPTIKEPVKDLCLKGKASKIIKKVDFYEWTCEKVHCVAPRQYNVIFYSKGNKPITKTVTYNTAIGTLPISSEVNGTSFGWYTKKVGGTQISSETIINKTSIYFTH